MTCIICSHPVNYLPHVCLVQTCPSCFSPKDIYDMYCSSCRTAPPCLFCQTPSKFIINNTNLCITHVRRTCDVDTALRHAKRIYKNKKYEELCLESKTIRKLGRPRLPALWRITNLRLRTGISE